MRQAVRKSHCQAIGRVMPALAEDESGPVAFDLMSLLKGVLNLQEKSVRRTK